MSEIQFPTRQELTRILELAKSAIRAIGRNEYSNDAFVQLINLAIDRAKIVCARFPGGGGNRPNMTVESVTSASSLTQFAEASIGWTSDTNDILISITNAAISVLKYGKRIAGRGDFLAAQERLITCRADLEEILGKETESAQALNHPYLPTHDGFVPLTKDDPPFWHLQWIKTNAKILRESYDEISRLVENRKQPIMGELDRSIRITESKSLTGYHEIRRILLSETERYLPEVQIPILRDFTKAWQWNVPMPDRTQFISEMQKIEHEANLKAVRIQEAQSKEKLDAFVQSANKEASTKNFQEWAGGEYVTLAIVFTDVIGSTALGEEIKDEAMNDIRRAHFAQSRKFIGQFKGYEIKTIGDSFMTAFKDVADALDYALALQDNTGHQQVAIRAGIHVGPMSVEEGDVFGNTVNFAARVISAITDKEIWLSDRAKEDIDCRGAAHHKRLTWEQHQGMSMKGFQGLFVLWSVKQ